MTRIFGWCEVLAATLKRSFASPKYSIRTSIWSVGPWTKRIESGHRAYSRGSVRSISSPKARRLESALRTCARTSGLSGVLRQLDEGLMVCGGRYQEDKGWSHVSAPGTTGPQPRRYELATVFQRAHRNLSGDRPNKKPPEVVRSAAGFSDPGRRPVARIPNHG